MPPALEGTGDGPRLEVREAASLGVEPPSARSLKRAP